MSDKVVERFDPELVKQIAIARLAAGKCETMREALWWALRERDRFVIPASLERRDGDALTRAMAGVLSEPVPPRPTTELVTVLDLVKGEERVEKRQVPTE